MRNKNLLGLLINTLNLALMPVVFYLSYIIAKHFSGDTLFAPLKLAILFLCIAVVPMYLLNVITKYLLDKFVYQQREAIIRTVYPNGGSLDMNSRAELEAHRELFKSLYSYVGSYPVWKVQQEFRELILALEPNTDNPGYEYHFHNIDNYLSKIITLMAELKEIRPSGDPFWDDEQTLSSAKGDYLLPQIRNKHPAFKEYSRD